MEQQQQQQQQQQTSSEEEVVTIASPTLVSDTTAVAQASQASDQPHSPTTDIAATATGVPNVSTNAQAQPQTYVTVEVGPHAENICECVNNSSSNSSNNNNNNTTTNSTNNMPTTAGTIGVTTPTAVPATAAESPNLVLGGTLGLEGASAAAAATKEAMSAVKQRKSVAPPPAIAKVYLWRGKSQGFDRSISLRPHRSEFFIGTSVAECTIIVNVPGVDLKHGRIAYDAATGRFSLTCLSPNVAGIKLCRLTPEGAAAAPFETLLPRNGSAELTYGTVFVVLSKAFLFAHPSTLLPPRVDPAAVNPMIEAGRAGIPQPPSPPPQPLQHQQYQHHQSASQQQQQQQQQRHRHEAAAQTRAQNIAIDEPLATVPPPPPLAVLDPMFPGSGGSGSGGAVVGPISAADLYPAMGGSPQPPEDTPLQEGDEQDPAENTGSGDGKNKKGKMSDSDGNNNSSSSSSNGNTVKDAKAEANGGAPVAAETGADSNELKREMEIEIDGIAEHNNNNGNGEESKMDVETTTTTTPAATTTVQNEESNESPITLQATTVATKAATKNTRSSKKKRGASSSSSSSSTTTTTAAATNNNGLKRKKSLEDTIDAKAPEGKMLRYVRNGTPYVVGSAREIYKKFKVQRAGILNITFRITSEFMKWSFEGVVDPETGDVCPDLEPIPQKQ